MTSNGFTAHQEGKFIADNSADWADVREMLKARHLVNESAEFKTAIFNAVVSIKQSEAA
jgi:hypothetical protein